MRKGKVVTGFVKKALASSAVVANATRKGVILPLICRMDRGIVELNQIASFGHPIALYGVFSGSSNSDDKSITSLSTGTFDTSLRNPISETNLLTQYMPQPAKANPPKPVVKNRIGEETTALAAAIYDATCPLRNHPQLDKKISEPAKSRKGYLFSIHSSLLRKGKVVTGFVKKALASSAVVANATRKGVILPLICRMDRGIVELNQIARLLLEAGASVFIKDRHS
ncbi:uncharacterized protein G2W53_030250 [Senna tora]|uniref:Uncharacterized protein n=1 Tax=Senna tora TaxID=362788 RepID=A0A834T756_9FABA|nr:uncharacterized protein G2W53_030250 [Senna tora]